MSTLTRAATGLCRLLPEGRQLPDHVWRRRHAVITRIALAQALGLGVLALGLGVPVEHAVLEAVVVALLAAPACTGALSRAVRAGWATASLAAGSAVLVHLTGGVTEAHFHFFLVVGLVSLYQDWTPFGIALGVVLAHHGVLGTTHPMEVYSTEHAQQHPWLWAALHGGYVLALSLISLTAWRLNEQQGLRDPLTGLANRTLLAESAARLLADPDRDVSVLFVDLDDFKTVNDSRGHATGDAVLVEVADRLRGSVRGDDVVARLGGDEFALLLLGPADSARRVGERVLRALAGPIRVPDGQTLVRASVGVASTSPGSLRDLAALLRDADLAMYSAKEHGKGRLAVYSEGMARSARDRAELAEDLAEALAAGRLEVHYQPSVALGTGEVLGVEALARWPHPRRGSVPPDEFVPLAEHAGLISVLGEFVLRTAARQAATWAARGLPLGIAVNLSAHQLTDDSILTTVRDALSDAGLPAQRLTLEVTESALIDDVELVADRLGRLRALGVRIAIDDFGTGFSSLSYLRRLPVDLLKIDRSFVTDLPDGGANAVLVSSIVELARSLHLDVVAEGVETPSQAQALMDLRCGRAQGYLYARPLPADELTALLQPDAAAPAHRA